MSLRVLTILGLPVGIFVLLWKEGIFWGWLVVFLHWCFGFVLVKTKDLVLVCDRRALCEECC